MPKWLRICDPALSSQGLGHSRDVKALDKLTGLAGQWKDNHSLASVSSHDGRVVNGEQSPAIYGGSIGYFIVKDPGQAKAIYNQKLASLYSADTLTWRSPLGYYDDNWTWFGLALYYHALPNLTNIR